MPAENSFIRGKRMRCQNPGRVGDDRGGVGLAGKQHIDQTGSVFQDNQIGEGVGRKLISIGGHTDWAAG